MLRRLSVIIFATVVIFLSGLGRLDAANKMEIVINLPAFMLYLYQDGVVVKTYPIGIGSTVNPSQLGTTTIINKVHHPTYYPPDWYRKGLQPIPPGPDNPVGTRWLGLGFKGYGIHGTNQPWTIGTAASAGCIRMYNHHVEELADLVGVGVPVTFMYETIETWQDPLTHRPLIKVHRDVYRQGTNRLERALQALERIGVARGVDHDFLEALLVEAAGEPRAVPYAVPLSLDGQPLPFSAVEHGGRLLLPLHSFARHFGESLSRASGAQGAVSIAGRVVPESFFVGDRAYAPVEAAAAAFGLSVETEAPTVALSSVRLVADGVDLSEIRTFPTPNWLWVPVQELGQRFGAPVHWDPEVQAVMVEGRPAFGATLIGGKAYIPHDRAESILGVRIRWSPGMKEAEVLTPKVMISGSDRVERGFLRDGQVLVPLRSIANHLGVTLGWNQASRTAYVGGNPVEGVVRDGRVYAPISSLGSIVDDLQFAWDEEDLRLELRIGKGAPREAPGS